MRITASGVGCKYQISQCGHPTSTKTKKVGGFSGGIFSMRMGVGVRGSVLGQYFGEGDFVNVWMAPCYARVLVKLLLF